MRVSLNMFWKKSSLALASVVLLMDILSGPSKPYFFSLLGKGMWHLYCFLINTSVAWSISKTDWEGDLFVSKGTVS